MSSVRVVEIINLINAFKNSCAPNEELVQHVRINGFKSVKQKLETEQILQDVFGIIPSIELIRWKKERFSIIPPPHPRPYIGDWEMHTKLRSTYGEIYPWRENHSTITEKVEVILLAVCGDEDSSIFSPGYDLVTSDAFKMKNDVVGPFCRAGWRYNIHGKNDVTCSYPVIDALEFNRLFSM